MGKAIKESVEEGSEAAIKQAIKAEIRRNFYEAFKGILEKYGVKELYQVHHIFCQRFFRDAALGPWLEKLGFYKDAARNVVALPTREAVRQGATRSAKAAIHEGGNIAEYYERVEKTLRDTMRRHTVLVQRDVEFGRAGVSELRVD